jgi:hypothetical protein
VRNPSLPSLSPLVSPVQDAAVPRLPAFLAHGSVLRLPIRISHPQQSQGGCCLGFHSLSSVSPHCICGDTTRFPPCSCSRPIRRRCWWKCGLPHCDGHIEIEMCGLDSGVCPEDFFRGKKIRCLAYEDQALQAPGTPSEKTKVDVAPFNPTNPRLVSAADILPPSVVF